VCLEKQRLFRRCPKPEGDRERLVRRCREPIAADRLAPFFDAVLGVRWHHTFDRVVLALNVLTVSTVARQQVLNFVRGQDGLRIDPEAERDPRVDVGPDDGKGIVLLAFLYPGHSVAKPSLDRRLGRFQGAFFETSILVDIPCDEPVSSL
jgi:hypothetical protein